VCDCLSLLFRILLIFRISQVLGNMINFLTNLGWMGEISTKNY
jgi:hypothetical protein